MTQQQLDQLAAQGYNRVPLMRRVLADLDTPLSAYLKLAKGPYSYLLESVQGGEKWGRYSMIGLPCQIVLQVRGHTITVHNQGEAQQRLTCNDPLRWIEDFQSRFKAAPVPGLPRFTGGLVGYFGYDTVRYIEPRLAGEDKPDPLDVPDILLMLSEEVLVFDNLSGLLYVIVHVDPAQPAAVKQAQARLDALIEALRAPTPMMRQLMPVADPPDQANFRASFTRASYEAAVEHIKHYIVEGDVMQVVPSQRMTAPFTAEPLELYRALRCLNPSPYMFYLDLADFHVVGASPEVLVRLEDEEITVRPIAGTRPRGKTSAEDKALEDDLLADPKELAEHLMLIDLGRNDVGRVAVNGSVEVTEKMVIERYSHVMHIVSNVRGQLKLGLRPLDALRATFPAGTVSGAPKIRAMEIINEVEPVKRGIYAGAVGYLGWHDNMDLCIAIRTAVIKHGELHVQAGGGIVMDSEPVTEWEETLNKRRALFRAAAMVEAGITAQGDD